MQRADECAESDWNGEGAHARLDGTDKGHGVARFDGVRVPSRVLDGVQAVMGHGNAPLRVA